MRFSLSKTMKRLTCLYKNITKKQWIIISIICAAVAASAALWHIFFLNSKEQAYNDDIKEYIAPVISPTPTPVLTPEPEDEPEAVPESELESEPVIYDNGIRDADREIDFEGLSERNVDFFAWLYVPGTVIDYPIVKSHDNSDYIRRDLDGKYNREGTIFMDMGNQVVLSDRITVLYGHEMKNGSKFADLHKFRDPEFFAENRTLNIYTPEGMRTYEIFAAYISDDRNILYEVDYFINEIWEAYIEEIFSNPDESANLLQIEFGKDDQILTLNTCVRGQSDKRLLVQGVLRRNLGTLEISG